MRRRLRIPCSCRLTLLLLRRRLRLPCSRRLTLLLPHAVETPLLPSLDSSPAGCCAGGCSSSLHQAHPESACRSVSPPISAARSFTILIRGGRRVLIAVEDEQVGTLQMVECEAQIGSGVELLQIEGEPRERSSCSVAG
ncbi:unnamed protein product [Linum trigynum]|uniref:Uncharacterized protein n=1 Tax=Linum trigynum TaxID=586398 RepID=A0AAV2EUV4_9ROSI